MTYRKAARSSGMGTINRKTTKVNRISRLNAHLKGDKMIWSILLLLGLASLLAVYSSAGAMAYQYADRSSEYYLVKQLMFIFAGFGVTYLAYKFHYLQYSRLAPIMLLIAIPLMAYTSLFGAEINDARRWINIPWINQSFQTSDFAKLALIVFIARSLAVRQDYIKDWKSVFLPIIIPTVLICGLILPSDFSTAGLLFITTFLMMFIARVSMKFVFILLLCGALLFSLMFIVGSIFPDFFRVDTWITRVQEFMSNNDGSFQTQQSKIAIANGGWIGRGPGLSLQKNHLPFAYADFIYAIICEEYGLLGGITILMAYLVLLYRCIRIVTQCPKAFGAILAMGLCLNLVVQAFANIAVSVQLVPVTGLTLPLVSMGGTSLLFTCLSIGIILSVSKYVEAAAEQKVALEKIEEDESDH